MEKIYQVYILDEYNNAYHLGFFSDLDKAIEPINGFLKTYNVSIKQGDIKETAGTFGSYFDAYLSDILYEEFEDDLDSISGVMIRGFIFDKQELLKEINNAN